MKGRPDEYAQGVVSVVHAVRADFDRLFPPDMYKAPAATMLARAEKVCHKEGCPICGATMHERKGKYGHFMGCTMYPTCGGTRNMSGVITINPAMREFIINEEFKLKIQEEELNVERFNIWEDNNVSESG